MTIATAHPTLTANPTVLAQLRAMGFVDAKSEIPRRLIASVAGMEKTGKTHFALTAPEPIIYFDVDVGGEGVVEKFKKAGKEILVYEVRIPKGGKQDTYAALWSDVKLRVEKAFTLGRGTVITDTATEMYELNRLARFGKLTQVLPHNYIEVNSEWREFLRLAYDSTMNAIFLHKMKAVWVNSQRTGNYEVAGFSEMDYTVQVNVRTSQVPAADPTQPPTFQAFVKDCRQNMNIAGTALTGPMFDFQLLSRLVHGN